MSISANVVILSKTKMSGDHICVGAYDIDNETMIRLLDSRAGTLDCDAPYEIGELYHITYARRYVINSPHVEDVAVYQYQIQSPDVLIENYGVNWFNDIAYELCDSVESLENIFFWEITLGE
ncbi:hypothetical protein [Dickeya ananatis]